MSAFFILLVFGLYSQSEGRCDDSRFVSPSFTCNGIPVDLNSFTVELKKEGGTDEYDRWTKILTAPDKRLQVRLTGKTYKKYPVMEYAVSLTNLSDKEATGVIGNFQSLDTTIPFPDPKRSTYDRTIPWYRGKSQIVHLNTLRGSFTHAGDFAPVEIELTNGSSHTFATPSGRSSYEILPFIELNYCEFEKTGYLFAVGWTGGWKAQFENKGDISLRIGQGISVRIGMIRTNFKLLPKETIIQPSITIFTREGMTRREFKTVVHRFMLANKVPRDGHGNVIPPILAVACSGGGRTPEQMLAVLRYVVDNKLPFDTYWIDAGWNGAPHVTGSGYKDWNRHLGEWQVNTTTHPTGTLLPIADAVHAANMKLLLWFEPERVSKDIPLRTKHPDYVNGVLFDMGNPAALKWMQNAVYDIIEKHHLDIYRQDFNTDPAIAWNELDAKNPERVGIAEAKHIAGMYQFLDDMHKRFPDLLQENCSSGGRRIDIEMISRAHSYCRSDYFNSKMPNDYVFLLDQTMTLNLIPYLPFQGSEFACVPIGDDYAAFSVFSAGTVVSLPGLNGGIISRKFTDTETQWLRKVLETADRMRPFYQGDFYPLTCEMSIDNTRWCGWQCDRPQTNDGFVIVFRRALSDAETGTFALGHIDASAEYELDFYDGTKKTVSGKDFANWQVSLPKRSFALVFYKKK